MNTDHKLGRAEAVRDMSRVIYDEVREALRQDYSSRS